MKPAELLRHYAPTQNHADRRAAFRAADFLDLAEDEGYSFDDPPASNEETSGAALEQRDAARAT